MLLVRSSPESDLHSDHFIVSVAPFCVAPKLVCCLVATCGGPSRGLSQSVVLMRCRIKVKMTAHVILQVPRNAMVDRILHGKTNHQRQSAIRLYHGASTIISNALSATGTT